MSVGAPGGSFHGRGAWLLAALLPTALAAAQPAPSLLDRAHSWRSVSRWQQAQGLPQDTVISLLQTKDGYLWMGTKGGVTRFDGVRFTTFDDSDRSRLRDNEVWALAEGADGSLWIGTYGGGVSRLERGQFTVFTKQHGLIHDYVACLCRDTAGGIWVGTDGGLSRYANGGFTGYGAKEGLSEVTVRALHCDDDGSVWVGTNGGGVFVVKDGRVTRPAFTGAVPDTTTMSIRRARDGTIWVATSPGGLYRLENGVFTRYTTDDGLTANTLRQVHEDGEGGLWVLSNRGLDRYRGPDVVGPRFENVFKAPHLSAMIHDHEGSLWVGTLTEGLVRLREGLFTSYGTGDGLADDYVATVIEDRHGQLWVGTGSGLNRLQGGAFVPVGPETGLPTRGVFALTFDREGRLWANAGSGVYRSRDECRPERCELRFDEIRQPGVTRGLTARVLYEDGKGTMWIGTSHAGLAKYEAGRLTRYTAAESGLSDDAVRAVVEDRAGNLWIGTRGGGLNRLANGVFTVYKEREGLVGDSIQALSIDANDVLWIGTRQGVSRLQDGRFTSYTAADGLFSNFVYAFVEDDHGNLWMSCSKGVFRVAKRELEDVAAGRAKRVTSIAYGKEHGLGSTVSAVGHSPSGFKTRDGRVWFASNNGLSVVDPARLSSNRLPPPVLVEEIRVDDQPVEIAPSLRLPPGRGDLAFHYTGLSFLAPEKVQFRYRLEGYDDDWTQVSNRRVAYYTNIPPGRYRFRVAAANNDGVWNEAGATVDLDLAPHFYQATWFYALCACAVALAGVGGHRLRVRRLKAQARELSQRVEESVAHLKMLRGLLPICASCKKIRDDKGYWNQMETYIEAHSEADFSHGVCPDCMARLYPDYVANKGQTSA